MSFVVQFPTLSEVTQGADDCLTAYVHYTFVQMYILFVHMSGHVCVRFSCERAFSLSNLYMPQNPNQDPENEHNQCSK